MRLVVAVGAVLLSFGGFAALIAFARGRNPVVWFVLGSVLGPIGVALVLMLGRVERATLPTPSGTTGE